MVDTGCFEISPKIYMRDLEREESLPEVAGLARFDRRLTEGGLTWLCMRMHMCVTAATQAPEV